MGQVELWVIRLTFLKRFLCVWIYFILFCLFRRSNSVFPIKKKLWDFLRIFFLKTYGIFSLKTFSWKLIGIFLKCILPKTHGFFPRETLFQKHGIFLLKKYHSKTHWTSTFENYFHKILRISHRKCFSEFLLRIHRIFHPFENKLHFTKRPLHFPFSKIWTFTKLFFLKKTQK